MDISTPHPTPHWSGSGKKCTQARTTPAEKYAWDEGAILVNEARFFICDALVLGSHDSGYGFPDSWKYWHLLDEELVGIHYSRETNIAKLKR